jgi:modulator of FtsH protease HflC
MKRNLLTLVIGAVLVIVFVLLLFIFQVRQSEVAVVTTFGRPVATYTNAGAYFKLPWPIQKVYKFDQRIQNFEDKFSENYTSDSVTLLSSVYVGWKISDGGRFLLTIRNGSIPDAQQKLEGILRSAKNAVIGKYELADFVNSDPKQLKFEEIESRIRETVQAQLATNNIGIGVEFLGFKRIGLPENVTQTVFDRMKSERQQWISKYDSEGNAEAQKIRSAAEREAAETVAKAEAQATQIRAAGEAEASKTFTVFQQNPELANFLLRIDALQRSLNQKSTLIFDERTPPFDLFRNLPANSTSK